MLGLIKYSLASLFTIIMLEEHISSLKNKR